MGGSLVRSSIKLGNKLTPAVLSNSLRKNQVLDYTADDRASYLLLRGSLLKALGKHDEAIAAFKEVIDIQELIVEKLYAPYCAYELGESYYIKGQLKEAQSMMKYCSKFTGYDWEDPLRVRLRVTMDQLNKGMKPAEEYLKPPSLDTLVDTITKADNSKNVEGDNNNDNDDDDNDDDDESKIKIDKNTEDED